MIERVVRKRISIDEKLYESLIQFFDLCEKEGKKVTATVKDEKRK